MAETRNCERICRRTTCPPQHIRHVLGFTEQMDELMAAADVVISKPGGLTASESLARGAAIVIIDPIPGQEARNADFLLENGAAVKVNNLSSLGHKLTTVLSEPGRLEFLRSNSRRIARPHAAFEVASRCLQLIEARGSQPPLPVRRERAGVRVISSEKHRSTFQISLTPTLSRDTGRGAKPFEVPATSVISTSR